MTYENPWLYNSEPFTADLIADYVSFVYCITNTTTNKKYIGKKSFYARKYKVVKKKRKKLTVESDWQTYYGSNEILVNDVATLGTDKFSRVILRLCKSKGEASYFEAKEQFAVDAVLSVNYYNNWISVRVRKSHMSHIKLVSE